MMPRVALLSLLVAICIAARERSATAAEARVDLEVALEPGAVPTEARAWTEMLSAAGFSSVRIRSGKDEAPTVETRGTAQAPAYRVVGILTKSNQVILPRGRFGLSDRKGIEQWLKKLRDDGEDGLNIKPAAFGLLPRQVVTVHEALAVPIESATLGKPAREVAKQIADKLAYKFIADGAAQKALAGGDVVADELIGLSSGTGLAAVLRPLGLVMYPEKNGSDIKLRIAPSANAKEHWPVGWAPPGNPSETLPELFKYLKIEINDTPLAEAMTAIAGRVKAPLLLDHNAVARDRIDVTQKVSHPATTIFYARALDRLLFQAKLKYELRVDEANKPFFWVTTLRQ
jgi:hypothetical protein